MKLVPTEPEVDLYNEGFEADDILQRRKTGDALSSLLIQVDDPLVVALDGRWGTGKTYFLKRWVGAHHKDHRDAIVIYFDAFAHDYLGDPLSSLIAALVERTDRGDTTLLDGVKKAALKLARPVARAGLAVATSGATEALGGIGGAIAGSLASDTDGHLQKKFWASEKSRRAAMTEFRDAMKSLACPADDCSGGANVIFVIDELDRCRPDCALELLEVIKHLFTVPHLHFVLGVNLKVLEEMVRVRYGTDIDAHRYLSKFIQVTLQLPDETGSDHHRKKTVLTYLYHLAGTMGIRDDIRTPLSKQVEVVARNNTMSLRDIGSIVSSVALASSEVRDNPESKNFHSGWIEVMNTLIVARIVCPDLYPKFLHATITPGEIMAYFGATGNVVQESMNGKSNPDHDYEVSLRYHIWLWLSFNGTVPEDHPEVFDQDELEHIPRMFGDHGLMGRSPKSVPMRVHRQWLDVFSFYQRDAG